MNGLRLALGFLTAIPVGAGAPGAGGLGRASAWFPAVGLLVGAALAAAAWGLRLVFPPLVAGALVVALWAGLTGGLHLDGLADCCDGLLAAVPRERRLAIMRDPNVGAFGAIGLTLFLILKVAAVAALLGPPPPPLPLHIARLTPYALLLVPTLARLLILPVARQPAARAGGLGAAFAEGLKPAHIALAAILPVGLLVLGGWQGAAAAGAACVAAALVVVVARARLGGVTGDVLGLTVEAAELAALLVFAAQITRSS